MLSEATKNSDFQVTINPKYLVPDTNCFVDMLSSIKTVVHATHFVVALPLTGELGQRSHDCSIQMVGVKGHMIA